MITSTTFQKMANSTFGWWPWSPSVPSFSYSSEWPSSWFVHREKNRETANATSPSLVLANSATIDSTPLALVNSMSKFILKRKKRNDTKKNHNKAIIMEIKNHSFLPAYSILQSNPNTITHWNHFCLCFSNRQLKPSALQNVSLENGFDFYTWVWCPKDVGIRLNHTALLNASSPPWF